ncbi:MAG TPA: PA0069 family radical SAM protein, partial [Labilithrix sp.]|nr:PA0069 family radical SAM protein [Labilithrix sp.]
MTRYLPVANPQNRFSSTTMEYEAEDNPGAPMQVYEDHSRSIIAGNDSPDVGFRWSVNPYRGCFHACSYCYARPSHEYLSLGAGSDFERKIIVKKNAAELLREAFDKKKWQGELVMFSGVTDCYQPLEAKLELTRACLQVCIEYKNPAAFITKSPIIERDVELLVELARVARCRVSVSIPFWNPDTAKAMEPFVTTPQRRMKIVETLAKAGIPVGVSISPIVPGLNDEDIGDVIKAASDAGARHAFYVLLRLPGAVKEVFETNLRQKLPLRAEKVLRRLREAHSGKLYDSRFGVRGSGQGVYADTIATLFDKLAKRHGLRHDEMNDLDPPEAAASTFERPSGQRSL